MSFARPDLLWLILALPALVALGIYGYVRRRRRVAERLGEGPLVERLGLGDPSRFPIERLVVLGLAAAALGIAAAGPRWGLDEVETRGRSLDLVLVADVSRSMLAGDLEPNRLERQRLIAWRLLRELQGDRIGLVVFAGRAYVLAPLTTDLAALQLYIDALDPEIVSQGGSSISSALNQATDLLRGARSTGGDRVIVLLTDGEALEDERAVQQAAARAAAEGIVVHTVGIGTRGGAPVPRHDPATGEMTGYTRDPEGEIVVSRRDDALMRQIATESGGRYLRADEARATEQLISAIRGMDRTTTVGDRRYRPRERFGWFIALALGLIALDTVRARPQTAQARGAEPDPQEG